MTTTLANDEGRINLESGKVLGQSQHIEAFLADLQAALKRRVHS